MRAGDVVGGRFEIEALAGIGGMGTVWRARDQLEGGLAALKVIHAEGTQAAGRFLKEARLLAELSHPAIVRYVAHGAAADGTLWLAMEWLDGEDLGKRLSHAGLSVAESVELVRRVADGLAVAPARGVVHRDLKPSNIFLPGGELERVKVLDFGVARIAGATRTATWTGVLVGTPGYMAPEQARGERALDARADVFSLGCVLFECLTGRAAFVGEHVMALLARILLEDAPRVRDLRPEVPAPVAALVTRMLAKSPGDRPRDGAALAAELEALGDLGELDGSAAQRASLRPPSLTTGEQALLCVVLVGALPAPPGLPTAPATPAAPATPPTPSTMSAEQESTALAQARAVVAPFQGRAEPLADGSLVVVVAGGGVATDQAVRAARCALALRAVRGGAPMALATGRGAANAPYPVGEAVGRAARLLRGRSGKGSGIALDEATAGLLDARFDVGGDVRGLELHAEREVIVPVRTLLGKQTRCVGRERELSVLTSLLEECIAEPVARMVLVTGPAGVGKSRLRYELLQAVAARDDDVLVLEGRGDPVRAGAPLGLCAEAVRREAGVLEGEPLVVRQQKIRARVARQVPARDRPRVAEFLGELVGAPFPDEGRVELRAARADPMLLADQMRRAWEEWLAAECAARPVVLVLEDLHWGDLPSTRFVAAALRSLEDRPLLVVALARPEVHAIFPDLWAGAAGEQLRLGELTRKASERLVRQVLGDDLPAELLDRLLTQAAGNPFYLEELVRAVAEGKGDRLPETVLAMV